MKEKFTKMVKGITDAKDQAAKVGKEAISGAKMVKDVIKTGVDVSKGAVKKAGEMLSPEKVSKGMEVGGEALSMAAKGVKLAGKGAEKVATGLEKASESVSKAGKRLKPKQ